MKTGGGKARDRMAVEEADKRARNSLELAQTLRIDDQNRKQDPRTKHDKAMDSVVQHPTIGTLINGEEIKAFDNNSGEAAADGRYEIDHNTLQNNAE